MKILNIEDLKEYKKINYEGAIYLYPHDENYIIEYFNDKNNGDLIKGSFFTIDSISNNEITIKFNLDNNYKIWYIKKYNINDLKCIYINDHQQFYILLNENQYNEIKQDLIKINL